ncbi:MAG TPA: hypothetical protein VFX59_07895, partial [Polyangiales bacterium]|nr:hypothetical protein [Polyangiales bacterium]
KFEPGERLLTKFGLILHGLKSIGEKERQPMQLRFDIFFERAVEFVPLDLTKLRSPLQQHWLRLKLSDSLLDLIRRLVADGSYARTCAAAEVPVPTPWPGSGWEFEGDVPWDLNLLRSGDASEVWTYQTAQGVCYALPRKDGSGAFELAGVICQSKRTGKACFWDNLARGTTARIAAPPLDVANMQTGATLAENCTNCHRGANAFLVTPGTPLSRVAHEPDVRYTPIGQASWVNPPTSRPRTGAANSCTRCHELPALSRSFCDRVLSAAAQRTMPSAAAPVGWFTPRGSFAAHVRELRESCDALPY